MFIVYIRTKLLLSSILSCTKQKNGLFTTRTMNDKRAIKTEITLEAIQEISRIESLGMSIELGDSPEIYPLASARFYCRITDNRASSKMYLCYDDDPSQTILRLGKRVAAD